MPSDNLITDNEKYCKAVSEGIKLAQEGYIVAFGVRPDRADVGMGYIRAKITEKSEQLLPMR